MGKGFLTGHRSQRKRLRNWTTLKLGTSVPQKTQLREQKIERVRENICNTYEQQGLVSRIYAELLKINKKKTNSTTENWQRTWSCLNDQ